jgi:hypothetical protein
MIKIPSQTRLKDKICRFLISEKVIKMNDMWMIQKILNFNLSDKLLNFNLVDLATVD